VGGRKRRNRRRSEKVKTTARRILGRIKAHSRVPARGSVASNVLPHAAATRDEDGVEVALLSAPELPALARQVNRRARCADLLCRTSTRVSGGHEAGGRR